MIRLSILIATTSARSEIIKPLLENLRKQMTDEVELIFSHHETDCIGAKRNALLQMANGDYVVFIDSDDHVTPNYVRLILSALETTPDCIGICGFMTTNGRDQRQWHISKEYTHWHESDGSYFRTPNHISPVRRELALQAGFPEISFGEDIAYSERLYPLLKTEVKIKQPIYHYDYSNLK